ncbi:hypothetical protein A2610_01785 [Candidatus Wolfebacteria bacterium RIFOXYD1_FULL_48_65]|uniref:Dipeptidylpeptidase IV N-terminal domain-containing protein n=1 Tax=Candidatus Wolfebacteria bacterium RIFOXYD1_FULL_48_65 TaxID=1802561 RepID=A0A1F8DZR5_9BACT|nr:MAG: hypothetical protein A2610_01785 [Candidatus Wolfebacteria bacterium RIFOXYD1_FULL_48_65]
MERNKKIIIGVSIALGVIALGLGAYVAWRNRAVVADIITDISGGVIRPLESKQERLRVISSREVSGYWMVTATSAPALMYADGEGNILRVDEAGDELVYERSIPNIATVRPSFDGSRVFVESKGAGGSIFRLFDAIERLPGVTLEGISEVTWAPTGTEAAYFVTVGDSMRLRIQTADLIGLSDSAKFTEVLGVPLNDFTIDWPQKDVLYMAQRPSAEYVSDLWRVDMKTKNVKKFLSDRGLMVQWAPFGTRALKFTTAENGAHKLALINDQGVELAAVKFITLPNKCVITAPMQMYCAIPRDQAAFARLTLPDDYLKRGAYTQDGIYQIDIANNGIRAIYEGDDMAIDATNLTVLEDKIIFINRYDRKLYSLDLQ